MGSFRTCRYAMLVLYLYANVFHVLVTIFSLSYTQGGEARDLKMEIPEYPLRQGYEFL